MHPFQRLDLSNEEYHSGEEFRHYNSRSKITRFIEHGRVGLGLERRGISLFTGNAGTSLGTVVDRWWDEYCHNPDVDPRDLFHVAPDSVLTANGQRRGNKFKAWREEIEASGGIEVAPAELAKACLMADSLKSNRLAVEMAKATVATQRSIFWESDEGHLLKIRADGDDGQTPYDLKTTSCDLRDPGATEFARKGWRLGYADQAALYTDGFVAMGLKPDGPFKFIAVQNVVPYRTRVLTFSPEIVEAARARVYNALNDMRDAVETEDFTDIADSQVCEMTVPPWLTEA